MLKPEALDAGERGPEWEDVADGGLKPGDWGAFCSLDGTGDSRRMGITWTFWVGAGLVGECWGTGLGFWVACEYIGPPY